MQWLKVWKTYQGGERSGYTTVESNDKDEKDKAARIWAERTPGGHTSGWSVFWEEVEKPDQEWLLNEYERLKRKFDYIDDYLKGLEKLMEK
jgi:hypothetical protein